MRLFVIIAGGGSGTRVGLGYNKLLYKMGNKTILEQTLCSLAVNPTKTLITCSPADKPAFTSIALAHNAEVVLGGETRTQSIKNALAVLEPNAQPTDIVLIHDGARPFTPASVMQSSVRCAQQNGSGVASVSCTDTLADLEGNAVPRDSFMCIQTPQSYNLQQLITAYNAQTAHGETFSDDSQVYKKQFGSLHFCHGSTANKKITTSDDLVSLPKVGNGYDIHELGADFRPLVLGGIIIPCSPGLIGHSDADVVTHALMDALLSASGERDIGVHFPSTPQFKDADSLVLLQKVLKIVSPLRVCNVALAIIAEKPRLSPYIPDMKKLLASSLGIAQGCVGITVTTAEGLGLIGHEKAIACYATALLV